jgi:hypothetical protein
MLIRLVTSRRSCRTIQLVANYVRQQVSTSFNSDESMRQAGDLTDACVILSVIWCMSMRWRSRFSSYQAAVIRLPPRASSVNRTV